MYFLSKIKRQVVILDLVRRTVSEASIEFDSGFYKYKAALVDVSKEHGVTNTGTTRILFKISVFDMEYEEVCNNLITRFS